MRASFARGEPPECPRCRRRDDGAARSAAGSFGLGYARKREWLICPQCRRSALFDVKRGTRN